MLGLATLLSACGSASEPSPPTGVDGLVIPTPSPDPDDFVERVDNRWLPLSPGTSWEYDVTGRARVVRGRFEALAGPVHDGITTTSLVRSTYDRRGRELDRVVDHVAQDEAGNVWWLGRGDVWLAEAGLMMPAEPRTGDGFLMADLDDGVVRAEVEAVGTSVVVPAGQLDDVVELDLVGVEDVESRMYLAAGVGIARIASADGTSEWGLVDHHEPPS